MCEHTIAIDNDEGTSQGDANGKVDNNTTVQRKKNRNNDNTDNANNTSISCSIAYVSCFDLFQRLLIFLHLRPRNMSGHTIDIEKDENTSQGDPNTNNTSNANTNSEVDNNTNYLRTCFQGFMKKLVDNLCRTWEPPNEPSEKEATMKSLNSLALACEFFSISIICSFGIATSIVPFLEHHKELSKAMSRMSSTVFLSLVSSIFGFSIVLFGITKTNSCRDRPIKIANIIGYMLRLLLTLTMATAAHMGGVLLPILGIPVATGVGAGIAVWYLG